MCNKENFICNMGADFDRVLELLDDNDVPTDLTGASALMQVRNGVGGPLIVELSVGNGITITPLDGLIALHLSAAQTSALDATGVKLRTVREYISNTEYNEKDGPAADYALELTYSGGQVERLIDGYFLLSPELVQ